MLWKRLAIYMVVKIMLLIGIRLVVTYYVRKEAEKRGMTLDQYLTVGIRNTP